MPNLQELKTIFQVILFQLEVKFRDISAMVFIEEGEEYLPLHYPQKPDQQNVIQLDLLLLQTDTAQSQLQLREPVLFNDISDVPELLEVVSELQQEGLENVFINTRCWIAVPIRIESNLSGIICLSHSQPGYFTPRNLRYVQRVAEQALQAHQSFYQRVQGAAVQEERQRMARELHDSVTQVFYGIQLGANTSLALLQQGQTGTAQRQLQEILLLAEAGLAEMRALLFELRPESLETEGLVAGLKKQLDSLKVRHSLKVEASFAAEPELPLEIKEGLYRIAQEALNNVVKHARASAVRLCFSQSPGNITLEVSDDGRGFELVAVPRGHLGLITMRERAALFNGTLEISSQPGQGTQVRVFVPTPEKGRALAK